MGVGSQVQKIRPDTKTFILRSPRSLCCCPVCVPAAAAARKTADAAADHPLLARDAQSTHPTYPTLAQERKETLASLRRRAHLMTDGFNALEGITCTFTEGAMYSFPQLHLPQKARLRAAGGVVGGLLSRASPCARAGEEGSASSARRHAHEQVDPLTHVSPDPTGV